MFFELTEHHFIAKKQSEFLRVKKASLKFDEAVLTLEFTENYSFIVQDCAQSYQWNMLRQQSIPLFYIILIPRQKELAVLCVHVSVIT